MASTTTLLFSGLALLTLNALGEDAGYQKIQSSCVVVHKSYWESTLLREQGQLVGKQNDDAYILLRFWGEDAKKMRANIQVKDTLSLTLPHEGNDFVIGPARIDSVNHHLYRP